MDQRTLEAVRRLLAWRSLGRLVVEDELSVRLGIGWSRAAVSVQWLIEEGVLIEEPGGEVRLNPAEATHQAPRRTR